MKLRQKHIGKAQKRETLKKDVQDALSLRLRGSGLRSTSARVAVLEYLIRARAPVSHADIADAFANEVFDRATVYRNLMDLTGAGLVTRTDLGDHIWRFELKQDDDAHPVHPHFVCKVCGDVACLSNVEVTISASEHAPKSVTKRDVEVQLRGVCDGCGEGIRRAG